MWRARVPAAAPPAIVAHAGTVEAWTLVNETYEVHAFHIHQVHFIVTAPQRRLPGRPVPERMTVLVISATPRSAGRSSSTVISPITKTAG